MNESIAIKKPKLISVHPSKMLKTDTVRSINSPIDKILFLQRTIGNQAVGHFFKSGIVQAKLKSGKFDSIYQQKTNKISEKIIRSPQPNAELNYPNFAAYGAHAIQRKEVNEGGSASSTPKCSVNNFKMKVNPWNREWPDGSGNYSLRLPVDFELELNSGCSPDDCLISQDKKGQVEYYSFKSIGGINVPIIEKRGSLYSNWTIDAPPGQNYWWDGNTWHAGGGSWRFTLFGLLNEKATFSDEPGFASPSALGLLFGRGFPSGITKDSFPIYWGGADRKGYFQFRTYVKDRSTGTTIRQLTWGMLINYSNPNTGAHYFYL